MPNGINLTAPDIRDFLLGKNLILSDTITDNGLSAYASGLGYPVVIQTSSVISSTDIEISGEQYRDLNIVNNPYGAIDDERISIENVPFTGNIPIGTAQTEYPTLLGSDLSDSSFNKSADLSRQQMLKNQYQPNEGDEQKIDIQYRHGGYSPNGGGYIDRNSNLNVGGPSTTALDYLGGALNGNFIGVDGKANFDIRSSLAGRVLGATGAINDTPLGLIGGQQLLTALANKAAFNAQRETLGQLNLSVVSLLSGDDIIVPNYSITVGQNTLKKGLDIGTNILGFENPTSALFDTSSSIFNRENPVATKLRADAQIANTGKGQVLALFANLQENKYRLGLEDKRTGDNALSPNLYMFDDKQGGMTDLLSNLPITSDDGTVLGYAVEGPNSPISPSNYKLAETVTEAGFESLKGIRIGDSSFVWADTKNNNEPNVYIDNFNANSPTNNAEAVSPQTYFTNQKTLLGKTQALFNTNKMMVLVSGQGAISTENSEVSTPATVGGQQFISKGSQVLSRAAIDGTSGIDPKDVFCRTWTSLDKYDQVDDLQKHSGLGTNFGLRNRNSAELSVLDDNGFVRIAPNIGDDVLKNDTPVNIKRFMFSLENLAWNDDYGNLPANERGPGDPMTGTKGRIMWFPPYELNFTDTTSVNWDSHSFIGRGEPLYTYNNSERSGTLSFKVIIDHASYINDMRGNGNNDLFASIAAGCYDFDLSKIKNLTKNEQDIIDCDNVVTPQVVPDKPQTPPEPFTIYFANDVPRLNIPADYEALGNQNTRTAGCGVTYSDGITSKKGEAYPDTYDYGLNKEYLDVNFIPKLKEGLKNCPACRIDLIGKASFDGFANKNELLSNLRADNVQKWFMDNVIPADDNLGAKRFRKVDGEGATGCPKNPTPVDALCKKKARRVDVKFIYDAKLNEMNVQAQAAKVESQSKKDLAANIKSRFFNEALYFQKLEQENKVVYDTLGEKIKYFHPAFHSITPEGFNSRLNFLEQCTRQGPTKLGGGPNNLAFGMAPVLILRIGDFYHTKIVMDNLDINFESGTGIQWDLNPEGIGVQPMIANVSIGFKFIGGQSLNGPINKLQNAVSFNFFANTEVYDPRASYIKINSDPTKGATYENDLTNGNLFAILGGKNTANPDGTINNKPETKQMDVAEKANVIQEQGNPDKVILSNAKALGNDLFQIFYEGTKLKGRFGVTNGTLSKEYDAKVTLMTSGGALDIASFKLGGSATGDFISAKDGWREALSEAANPTDGTVSFGVKIPAFPEIVFYEIRCIAKFNCPQADIDSGDIVDVAEWKGILEDPCCECYGDGYTANKEYVLNGNICPFSGC